MHPVTRPSFPGSTKSIMHEAQKVCEPAPRCRPTLRHEAASLGIQKDAYYTIKPMRAGELMVRTDFSPGR